jgi:hypothetical protein
MKEAVMSRSLLFALFAMALGTEPVLAQFGGMGGAGNAQGQNAAGQMMGMMRGGMQGMGGRGGGMGGGMGGMGGGMGGFQEASPRRTVQVEIEGGKKLSGKMQLGQVFVKGDLGQYMIRPEFVKIIHFIPEDKGEDAQEEKVQRHLSEGVITTSGEEIRGPVQLQNWLIEIECGTLNLDSKNVRTMTFLPPTLPKAEFPGAASERKPASLDVTTIEAPNAVALMVTGPNITRLAAATEIAGDWIAVDLREPVNGRAVPIVAQGIVVYGLGRYVYAFGSEAGRWDVLALPEGATASPVVSPGSARVEFDGKIHAFDASAGKWKHIDIHALIDSAKDKALKALKGTDKALKEPDRRP